MQKLDRCEKKQRFNSNPFFGLYRITSDSSLCRAFGLAKVLGAKRALCFVLFHFYADHERLECLYFVKKVEIIIHTWKSG